MKNEACELHFTQGHFIRQALESKDMPVKAFPGRDKYTLALFQTGLSAALSRVTELNLQLSVALCSN